MSERLARQPPHVLLQAVDEGAVLLDTRAEVYFALNTVGARICVLLRDHDTLEELCRALADEYPGVPEETLRQDVRELLDELEAHGLLEPRLEVTGPPASTPAPGDDASAP
jgi:hypothetical protein